MSLEMHELPGKPKADDFTRLAIKLAESFLNGNRKWVTDEITKLRKDRALVVALRTFQYLPDEDRGTMVKIMENRVMY